jgi:hypothetical protein
MGFAVYKVFMFAKNRELKGYSRRMTLTFLIIVLFIFFVSLLIIRSYEWNDNFSYYCKIASPKSCICEPTQEKQKICQDEQKKATEDQANKLPQS